MTITMTCYAKGIAHAVLGDVPAAKLMLDRLLAAAALIPTHYVRHNNTCEDIVAVGLCMLRGEILYREGMYTH
jgi:hypothetical protein